MLQNEQEKLIWLKDKNINHFKDISLYIWTWRISGFLFKCQFLSLYKSLPLFPNSDFQIVISHRFCKINCLIEKKIEVPDFMQIWKNQNETKTANVNTCTWIKVTSRQEYQRLPVYQNFWKAFWINFIHFAFVQLIKIRIIRIRNLDPYWGKTHSSFSF